MELELVHLYHDLLNTYGDSGNIRLIAERARRRGIEVRIHKVTVGERIDACDLLFLGGGQDYEQTIASEDLIKNRGDFLRGYVNDGGVALCICGGYQLMGEYYIAADGNKMAGLSALPIYTDAGGKRFIGNLIIRSPLETLVGFENHSGCTFIGDLKPLGQVLYGNGNNGRDGSEGCVYNNVVCTYMHGPLLSKNPALCDDLIRRTMIRKYGACTLDPLDDRYENAAKQTMIKRLLKESDERQFSGRQTAVHRK